MKTTDQLTPIIDLSVPQKLTLDYHPRESSSSLVPQRYEDQVLTHEKTAQEILLDSYEYFDSSIVTNFMNQNLFGQVNSSYQNLQSLKFSEFYELSNTHFFSVDDFTNTKTFYSDLALSMYHNNELMYVNNFYLFYDQKEAMNFIGFLPDNDTDTTTQ
jgi:hypothetical protein